MRFRIKYTIDFILFSFKTLMHVWLDKYAFRLRKILSGKMQSFPAICKCCQFSHLYFAFSGMHLIYFVAGILPSVYCNGFRQHSFTSILFQAFYTRDIFTVLACGCFCMGMRDQSSSICKGILSMFTFHVFLGPSTFVYFP